MKNCPDCGGSLDVDICNGYEVVCFSCGYFVGEKFKTENAAFDYIESSDTPQEGRRK